MRVMVFVKATEDSERGLPPAAEMTAMFEAMGKFNEELVKAGVMIEGDGLKPSSAGKRIAFDGANRTVIDGPFAEARELVAGYWVWEVKNMDEAIRSEEHTSELQSLMRISYAVFCLKKKIPNKSRTT